ncbi:GDP dissociation inhibitor family protein / Rab GTPase activator family protein, partial [Reticulomyxa filosa]
MYMYTYIYLVGDDEAQFIPIKYLSDSKSEHNLYGNFEFEDRASELIQYLMCKRDNSDDNDNEHENESANNGDEEKKREEEKENERDLEEVQYLEHLQQVLTIYENKYRQILVDLIPNVIYSNESFIDILVRSEVSRYVEFRGIINHFVYFDGVNASKVPLSKGEVLASKELSINEKRQLMKFMQVMVQRCSTSTHGGDSSGNSNNDSCDSKLDRDQFGEQSFVKLMEEQQLSPKVQDFIKYELAFLDSPTDAPTVEEMLQRLRLYFQSMGRFCDGAFLFPLYGCGDLAQGFCRSSAVKGGVFILNWTVQGMVAQPSLLQ